ncbi:hypothetical protein KIW84_050244 [Lathyrus oleraceus]|uniref:Uncharacterized protein n=1 Tax=Pisum sativum TaxID=3888 RepID=A0A9D5A948_PEA|nr:hypothetical protein KIW84_050244 [Pisum sativum]
MSSLSSPLTSAAKNDGTVALVKSGSEIVKTTPADEYCQQALLSLIEKFKHACREHLHCLAARCSVAPARILSDFFIDEGVPAAVRVESLQCYAFLCSLSQDKWQTELLANFLLFLFHWLVMIRLHEALNDRDAHFTDQSSMSGMVNPSFRDTWTDEYGINRHFNPNQRVGTLEDRLLS